MHMELHAPPIHIGSVHCALCEHIAEPSYKRYTFLHSNCGVATQETDLLQGQDSYNLV